MISCELAAFFWYTKLNNRTFISEDYCQRINGSLAILKVCHYNKKNTVTWKPGELLTLESLTYVPSDLHI